jgi:transcriptional/translational regulatory protein YebC/TACO1
VTRLFARQGQVIVSRDAAKEDAVMEAALEEGATDFRVEPEGYEILTEPARLEAVLRKLEALGIKPDEAGIVWLPSLTVPISAADAPAFSALVEALEEHEDVKEVHTNADLAGVSV